MNTQLLKNNYIIIQSLIQPSRAKSLAEQFNTYCAEHHLNGDEQVENCYAKYNFVPFVELLVEQNAIISMLVEENVLPTYSYARNYRHGNVLTGHIDKSQCEISLTVNLECDEVWDIWIETPHGREYVSLNPGDAMLYLGMEGEHGREPFNGESCTQVFLHYVRSNGPYFRDYFDIANHGKEYVDDGVKTNTKIAKTSKSSIADYIKVYDNIFTSEECKTILDEYKNSDEWTFSKVGSEGGIEDKTYRNCENIGISLQDVIEKNQSKRKNIDELIHKKTIGISQDYCRNFPWGNLTTDSGYNLLRYKTGGFYREHTDSGYSFRTVAMSINLNDDYGGGSMAFFNGEVDIRGGLGSVIIFPANFMYPHQIMEVTKGIRYSIVTWLI
jgi:hypothetical protein